MRSERIYAACERRRLVCPGSGPWRLLSACDPRKEAHEQFVGLLGALDLRDVPTLLERDLLGARQPAGHVTCESAGNDRVVVAPDEERRH